MGLWNATLTASGKGFRHVLLLSLFAAIAVQKNTRDGQLVEKPSREANDRNREQGIEG
ncbi:MAG: YiaA/YiaB family inner membrane protein [Hymenobacter sp.]